MKRLHALPEGAGLVSHNPAFRSILVNLVTPATRAHEKAAASEHAWRAVHLISNQDRRLGLGSWRSTVAHHTARAFGIVP